MSTAVDDVSEQRIYHVTSVRNLPGILAAGAIYAAANPAWDGKPAVDISAVETRGVRRAATVGSRTAADFVPFFVTPHGTVWQSIRSDNPEPRLSRDILGTPAADFVLLVSTVRQVMDADGVEFVAADADAPHPLARFGSTPADAEQVLRRLRATQFDSGAAILEAEFLVEDAFPIELITLIGVAHEPARAVVKDILNAEGFSAKVAVYPPWFAPSEDGTPLV